MIKKILRYPEDVEILSQKSEEVNWEDEKELVQDLKDTLDAKPAGAGISAIQIGVPKRICIIRYAGKELVMFNPVITWRRNNTQLFREGCLSSPLGFVEVPRAQKVICEYTDENGEKQTIGEGGWMSAIIQHELDHFEGICQPYELLK